MQHQTKFFKTGETVMSTRNFAAIYSFTYGYSYFYGYGYFGMEETANVEACTSNA
ncbi:MAG: hypothetical protein ACFWT7_08365 [Succiniclasticum sp.]|jgi:hypothetical protein